MKEKTHKKLNISLPKELHDWVLKKQAEENKKSPLAKTAISSIIADAIQKYISREEKGKSVPQNSHKTITPSEIFDGGLLTRKTANSRRTGKAK